MTKARKADRNHVDRQGSGVADDARADEIRSTGLVMPVVKANPS